MHNFIMLKTLVNLCLGPEPTTPITPQPSSLSSSKRESARVYHNLVSMTLCCFGVVCHRCGEVVMTGRGRKKGPLEV